MGQSSSWADVLDTLHKPDVQLSDLPAALRQVVEAYARASEKQDLLAGEYVGQVTAEALWAVWDQGGHPADAALGTPAQRAKKWIASLLPVVRCVLPAIEMDRPLQRIEALGVLADRTQVMGFVNDEVLAEEIGEQARLLIGVNGKVGRTYSNWWNDGVARLEAAVARAAGQPSSVRRLTARAPVVHPVEVAAVSRQGAAYWATQATSLVLQSGQLGVLTLIAVVLLGIAGGLWVLRPWEAGGAAAVETATPAMEAGPTQTVIGASTATPAPTANRSSSSTPTPATTRSSPSTPAVAATAPPAAGLALTRIAPVTAPAKGMKGPQLVMDGAGTVHLFWFVGADERGVWHRQLGANGAWSEAELLTEHMHTVYEIFGVARQVDGAICVYWEGGTIFGDLDTYGIYLRCLKNEAWSKARLIFKTPLSMISYNLYFDQSGEARVLYADHSRAYLGETTVDGRFSGAPAVVVDAAGRTHVVWVRDSQLTHWVSADGGGTWQGPDVLTDEQDAPSGSGQRLAVDGQGNLHLIWLGGAGRLMYRRWTANGGWGAAEEAARSEPISSESLGLALDGEQTVYLIWCGWSGFQTLQRRLGEEWDWPEMVPTEASTWTRIVVDGQGERHLVWGVKENEQNVLYYGVLSDKAE